MHACQVRDLVRDHVGVGVLLFHDLGVVGGVLHAVAGRHRLSKVLDRGGWRFRNWRAARLISFTIRRVLGNLWRLIHRRNLHLFISPLVSFSAPSFPEKLES